MSATAKPRFLIQRTDDGLSTFLDQIDGLSRRDLEQFAEGMRSALFHAQALLYGDEEYQHYLKLAALEEELNWGRTVCQSDSLEKGFY